MTQTSSWLRLTANKLVRPATTAAFTLAWLASANQALAQRAIVPPPAQSSQDTASDVQIYLLRVARAAEVEPILAQMLSGLKDESEIVVDAKANRLVVSGSPDAHRVARELIRSLDTDRPVAPPRAAAEKSVLQTYPLGDHDPARVGPWLEGRLGKDQGVQIAVDQRTAQIIAVAPPQMQGEIARLLGIAGPAANVLPRPVADQPVDRPLPARRGAANTIPAANGQPAAQVTRELPLGRVGTTTFQLENVAVEQIEQSLSGLFRDRVRAVEAPRADVAAFVVQLAENAQVSWQIDRRTGLVELRGPLSATGACARLLRAWDVPPGPAADNTRIVPIRYSKPAQMRQAIAAVQSGDGVALMPAPRGKTVMDPGGLAMVNRVFQNRQAEEPAEDDVPPVNDVPADDGPANEAMDVIDGVDNGDPEAVGVIGPGGDVDDAGGGLMGPVQLEYLEGLDTIIIRGSEKDVQRVMKIIEDIERLSVETVPAIEVHPLKHVGSAALAEIITQLNDQVLSPRQGRVSITALVKPNALLLIGREESVKTVGDLIEKLDQPVSPQTEFEVFALRHASASAAAATITAFFEERTALGTKVLVTADFRSNSLIVQASPRDMEEVGELIKRLDTATSEAVNELRVFKLRNTLADDMAPILQEAITAQEGTGGGQQGGGQNGQQGGASAGSNVRSTMLRFLTVDTEGQRKLNSGILTDVKITADARANALLISAPAESMELLEALVEQMDQAPAATAQIKVFTIVNGDPQGMVTLLESLFGSGTTRQGQGQGAIFNPFGGGGGNQGEGTVVPLRFSVDSRTNSVIASGSNDDLAVVEAVLLRLDESDVQQRKSTVYRLKNAPVLDVAQAINDFLTSEREVQQASETASPFSQLEREVVVVPEQVSNSLIVSATPRFYDEIAKIVEQLDARPPQVMIQVLIGEVSLNNTDEFGVELGLQDSLLFDRSLLGDLVPLTTTTNVSTPAGVVTTTQQTIVGASNNPGYNFNNQPLGNSGSDKSLARSDNVGGQGLSSFGVGRVNSELGFGGLVLAASSESVSVLIRALQESRRLDVLSRPQIMTLDNQPALVQVGQRVPVIQSSSQNATGTINTVNFENVGIILGVTPRISPDGLVVMEIDAEKSSLGPVAEGIPISIAPNGDVIRSPRIDITLAQTTVSALNGQTVVLGGLITKSDSQVTRRVPLLSDIPILGNLFRYDSDSTRRTEMLIIMTPHIVRSEDDAEQIKQVEAARMSWCLGDVRKIHGDGGLRNRGDEWSDVETTVIYPDENPAGEIISTPHDMIDLQSQPPVDASVVPIPTGPELPAEGLPAERQPPRGPMRAVPPRNPDELPAEGLRPPGDTGNGQQGAMRPLQQLRLRGPANAGQRPQQPPGSAAPRETAAPAQPAVYQNNLR